MAEDPGKRKPRVSAWSTSEASALFEHVLSTQELHGQQIEGLKVTQAAQQEQLRTMSSDMQELKKQLDDMKEAILASQQKASQRMIAVQGAILFLVLSTVVGLLVKVLFP